MRTIIAGSRGITDPGLVEREIEWSGITVTEVLCGEARGADLLGRRWAEARKIPVRSFPADWDRWGRAAGMLRNQQMAAAADAAVILWDGQSLGARNMMQLALSAGLRVHIFTQRRDWVAHPP